MEKLHDTWVLEGNNSGSESEDGGGESTGSRVSLRRRLSYNFVALRSPREFCGTV